MKKSLIVMLWVFFSWFSTPLISQEQVCIKGKPETTPTARFSDQGDGTVKDARTNKIWLRCAVGLQWDGSSCTGQSKAYNYAEIRGVVEAYNRQKYAQRSNWRLPSRDELLSIVESRCYNPAINLAVFPYSPQSGFWTATEDVGLLTTRQNVVHFLNGGAYISNRNQAWRARLISD